MLATILGVPPQRWHVSISMPNTRFKRFARLIVTSRGGGTTCSVNSFCPARGPTAIR